MKLPYFKVDLVVFVCLGVHSGLGQLINEHFTDFTRPEYPGISKELFDGVKKTYKQWVLDAVSDLAAEYMEEFKRLINLILPHLQDMAQRNERKRLDMPDSLLRKVLHFCPE